MVARDAGGDAVLVVGAAVVRDGRLLAARRTRPASAAGRWELPGGKVEDGEDPAAALAREVAEELGCRVAVVDWLPGIVPVDATHTLRVAWVRLVSGEPDPREHDRLRWLGPDELSTVDWLDPDRPFLPAIAQRLRQPSAAAARRVLRGIFFDEADAVAVAGRLRADGYAARVERERLAGEDDDEDHPWAVLTDAPEVVLDLLVDEHDGWLDVDDLTSDPAGDAAGDAAGGAAGEGGAGSAAPLDLPDAPRRVKRPQ